MTNAILTNEQLLVINWINEELSLPVFAEAYRIAINSLNAKTPGYVTIIAHVGRDIANSLARTVAGTDGGRVQYEQLTKAIEKLWKDEWGVREDDSRLDDTEEWNDSEGHLVSFDACVMVKKLLAEHDAGRERNNLNNYLFFRTFLDYDDIERIPENLLDEWKEAREWFPSFAHCRERSFSVDERRKTEKHFQTLQSMLYAAASGAYERIKGLNEILESTNS